ncbi:MAG: hypothetical protein IIZ39_02545, partial [Blautia sp.]|nr:hypothetical protein [Blautia sp.]
TICPSKRAVSSEMGSTSIACWMVNCRKYIQKIGLHKDLKYNEEARLYKGRKKIYMSGCKGWKENHHG